MDQGIAIAAPRAHPFPLIRPYRETDRPALRRLCCDTAFLGHPIDPVFCDRPLFAAIFIEPYLDLVPDWTLVAEAEGRVVGYLTGGPVGFERRHAAAASRAVLHALARLAAGAYRHHPRSRRFLLWLLTRAAFERPPRPEAAAHMHFNIESRFRGRHLAQALWRGFEAQLRTARIPRYYGEVRTERPARVLSAYGRYGLEPVARRRTTIFEPERPGRVWTVLVTKSLTALKPPGAAPMLSNI